MAPDPRIGTRTALIRLVPDRPGHDFRYALDASRIRNDLGWRPRHDFACGLRKTVEWYLAHRDWTGRVQSGAYRAAYPVAGAGA
jgi:dTDP-glucose 4,6-dehydratase